MNKIAYLTIDDSPSPDFMNKLDFLDSHNIKAVWFSQGNYMDLRPEWIIDAIRRGHLIGNHSYSHPHFSELNLDQAYAEIRATHHIIEELYEQAGVKRPVRYFRFPYGDKGDLRNGNALGAFTPEGKQRHDAIQAYLRKLGYEQPPFPDVTYDYIRNAGVFDDADMFWTYDSFDWVVMTGGEFHGVSGVDGVMARLDQDMPNDWRGLNSGNSAEIVLTHDHDVPENIFIKEMTRMIEKGLQFRPAW